MSAEPWCDMSDLPQSQCGLPCCKPPTPEEKAAKAPEARAFRRAGDSPVIVAQSYSDCEDCGEEIEPGDRITKKTSNDYWSHEVCP